MILVDTGPLIALFDPRDADHVRCVRILKSVDTPLTTTIAVLTEAFHMLQPGSRGADALREFVVKGGLSVWFFDDAGLVRAFELMEKYRDRPMDVAGASLVVAAERLGTRRVFTLDGRDFTAYRVRHGHRHYPFQPVD